MGDMNYTVCFRAGELPLTELEACLARDYGARDITIASSRVQSFSRQIDDLHTAGELTTKEYRVASCLADGNAWRNAMLQAKSGIDGGMTLILMRLERRGLVRKIRNGVWVLSSVQGPIDIPDPFHRNGTKREEVYEMLFTPKTIAEIQQASALTRQRVDQIVASLVRQGKVAKLPSAGPEQRFVYLRTDVDPANPGHVTGIFLKPNELRVLNAIPGRSAKEAVVDHRGIAKLLKLNPYMVRQALIVLSEHGLAEMIEFPKAMACRLTDLGARHPRRDEKSAKAKPTLRDSVAVPTMISALLALHRLGRAQTNDLTRELNIDFGDRSVSMGNFVQCMQNYQWVEKVSSRGERSGRPFYTCTAYGKSLVSWLEDLADGGSGKIQAAA